MPRRPQNVATITVAIATPLRLAISPPPVVAPPIDVLSPGIPMTRESSPSPRRDPPVATFATLGTKCHAALGVCHGSRRRGRRHRAPRRDAPARPPIRLFSGGTIRCASADRSCPEERFVMGKMAVISVDGHVKASRRDYRGYISEKYLEAFDEEVRAAEEAGIPDAGNLHPELDPAVQWDSDRRSESLEAIGVVAEVLFPNGQPFQVNRLDDYPRAASAELADEGRQAYNRWLADF